MGRAVELMFMMMIGDVGFTAGLNQAMKGWGLNMDVVFPSALKR